MDGMYCLRNRVQLSDLEGDFKSVQWTMVGEKNTIYIDIDHTRA